MDTLSHKIVIDGHVEIADFIEQIENDLGVTLMARHLDDTVHGYVEANQCYIGGLAKTLVVVHLYKSDEPPTTETNIELMELVNESTKDLPAKDRKDAREKQAMILGGHNTTLKKATNLDKKMSDLAKMKIVKSDRIK